MRKMSIQQEVYFTPYYSTKIIYIKYKIRNSGHILNGQFYETQKISKSCKLSTGINNILTRCCSQRFATFLGHYGIDNILVR